MAADEPPYLTVGTDVSAKYKGAFCEAKIKKVNRVVKCKVTFQNNQGSLMLPDDQIKGALRIGAFVEARHPEKNQYIGAVINKMQDYSQYTVVFDDGDETTLRRTSLCLKSGRHFAESPTLDQFPLTNPEHFGTPVIGVVKSKRKRRSTYNSAALDYSSSDEELIPKKTKSPRNREKDRDIGKVVCVEYGDRRKKDNWYPGLVVLLNASQDTFKINTKEEYLIRSFKDGKYYQVPKRDTREFSKDISRKVESNTLKTAVEKALLYCEKGELPPHWDKAFYLGLETVSGDDDLHDSDTDTSDDEPSEEKDRFVAQLYKFMDERGTPINKAPTVSSKDVNLYKLFKVVHKMGGYNRVTNQNKWKIVYTKMGLQSSNPSGANQLKVAYKRFLHSFEDFYRKLGCTMVTNSRSTRGRHRSDRNFMITRNAILSKVKGRGKDKSLEKKTDERSEMVEKKEIKVKSETPRLDEKVKRKVEKTKTEEKPLKVKTKKEEEKPRLFRSQSLNKEKRDVVEDKKDTRTDRARAREESKKEKVESPDKKKETRSSAKFEAEKKDKSSIESSKTPETKDRPPREKKEEKTIKDVKSTEKKDENLPKERKFEKLWRDRSIKEDKPKPKTEEVVENKDDTPEKKERLLSVDSPKHETFTREKREKPTVPQCEKEEAQVKTEKEDAPADKCPLQEKETQIIDPKETCQDEEASTTEKQKSLEDNLLLSEVKTEQIDVDIDTSLSGRSFVLQEEDNSKESMSKGGGGGPSDDMKSLIDLTDSDDDHDGSGSEKSDKEGKEGQIEVGDKVRVRYGRGRTCKVYEAKVLKIEEIGLEKKYFVHYAGWNIRYDEWIRRGFIVENISERNKLSRQRRLDMMKGGSLPLMKKSSPGRPPGFPCIKLFRKNSTSSTTSVSSSRTTRSDKNISCSTSSVSRGLLPKRRMRRKSGISSALTDTSQDSESEEDYFLYPDKDNDDDDEEERECETDSLNKSFNEEEISSNHEEEKDVKITPEKDEQDVPERIETKPEPALPKDNEDLMRIRELSVSLVKDEIKHLPLKENTLMKQTENIRENRPSCIFPVKGNGSETKYSDNRKESTASLVSPYVSIIDVKAPSPSPGRDCSSSISVVLTKSCEVKVSPVKESELFPKFLGDITGKDSDEHDNDILKPIGSITTLGVEEKSENSNFTESADDKQSCQATNSDSGLEPQENTMPTLFTTVPSGIISSMKTPVLEPKELTEISNLKPQKVLTNPEEKQKIISGNLPNLLEVKPRERTTCNIPNVVQHVGLFGDINFSLKTDITSRSSSLSPRPVKRMSAPCEPHVLIKPVVSEEIIEKMTIPKFSKNISTVKTATTEKVEEKQVSISDEIKVDATKISEEKCDATIKIVNLDTVKKVNTSETPCGKVSDCKFLPFREFGKAENETNKNEFNKIDSGTNKLGDCPPTAELEVNTSCSAFPIQKYFTDFNKPISTSCTSFFPIKISSNTGETFTQFVPTNIKEQETVDKDEDTCPFEAKSNEGKGLEIKDAALQTSVITFVSSSSSSSSSLFSSLSSSSSSATDFSLVERKTDAKEEKSIFLECSNENTNDYEINQVVESSKVDQTMLPPAVISPKREAMLSRISEDEQTSTEESLDDEEEDKDCALLASTGVKTDFDENIQESLTELSINDENRDKQDRISFSTCASIGNVFSNVSAEKSLTDVKELFVSKKIVSDTLPFEVKKDETGTRHLSVNQRSSSLENKMDNDVATFSSCLKEFEDNGSSCSLSMIKKESKKKKSKVGKKGSDFHKKDDGKNKSKKKRMLESDESYRARDADQKPKSKKFKKNKNKKRFSSKYEDLEMGGDDPDEFSERLKRKDKRKREEKKFSKFELKSEEFRGGRSKKERRKNRKNKLSGERKSEFADKKMKEKKIIYGEDSDSEKETPVRMGEKKKRKEKKKNLKEASSSDDAGDGKLMIDEAKGFTDLEDKSKDPDMSFLLCEEKVPASPVNTLPEDTTASSSIDDSNNVSPSSDEEQQQIPNLEVYPSSSTSGMSHANPHNVDSCTRFIHRNDNTPPTTPSSSESIPSSSPSHDREPFVHYTESTQSGRDSGDNESDGFPCNPSHVEVSESEEYSAAATLAFAVCKSISEKPQDCSRPLQKRQKSDEYSPAKRRKKTKRSFGMTDTPVKSGHARIRGMPQTSKGDVFDDFEPEPYSQDICSPPPAFSSFSHPSNQSTPILSERSKHNFYLPLHEFKDPEKRISILQDKMCELRKMYASLKAEVASIDRRRKKARKKMREAAGPSANTSSLVHSEEGQNYS